MSALFRECWGLSTPVDGDAVFQTVAVIRLPLNPVGVTKRLTTEKNMLTFKLLLICCTISIKINTTRLQWWTLASSRPPPGAYRCLQATKLTDRGFLRQQSDQRQSKFWVIWGCLTSLRVPLYSMYFTKWWKVGWKWWWRRDLDVLLNLCLLVGALRLSKVTLESVSLWSCILGLELYGMKSSYVMATLL